MLLDTLAIAALVDEMRDSLLGARVQDVVQPDRLTVALELYAGQRRYLTLSADPNGEGVHLSAGRVRRGVAPPTPLTLALAARGEGARLVGVNQPPFERILELDLQGAEPMRLVAELTGRLANLVLVDLAGTVLAVARPVTPQMTRSRVLLPGRPYQPPPAPAKRAPSEVGATEVAAWLAAAPTAPAWRTLVAQVRGLAPLAAREIAHRGMGEAQVTGAAADPARLAAALAELMGSLDSRQWAPSVAGPGDEVTAYAAYALTHLPDHRPAATLSAAMDAYLAARATTDPYGAARADVAARLARARERVARQLAALVRQQRSDEEIQSLREAGDLILAFQHQLAPGQTELTAGFDPANPRSVALDPSLTAAENAQRYFGRYKRARRAAAGLPQRQALAEARLATLDQLAVDLLLATDRAGIDAVHDMLVASGFVAAPTRQRAAPAGGPLRWVSDDGLVVLVGRNSRQNETVTFGRAARGDLWLHARSVPGAHVVVKTAGREVPERTLLAAAAAAAWFSRSRHEARVEVAVTDVRHVRRLAGGGPGMVTFDRATTVVVRPSPPGPGPGAETVQDA